MVPVSWLGLFLAVVILMHTDEPELSFSLSIPRQTDIYRRVEELKKSQFMTLPSLDEVHKCMASFIQATGNQALATAICAACAQSTGTKKIQELTVDKIPHSELLMPHKSHPTHFLCNDMLLHREAIKHKGIILLCHLCLQSLQQGLMP